MTASYSGGCQCGAVRFRVDGKLGRASLCHCRMCQKATGGPFGAYVELEGAKLTWTRGMPARFVSSNRAQRGFCNLCGTPLLYEAGPELALSICAFDDPDGVPPAVQLSPRTKIKWLDAIEQLPIMKSTAPPAPSGTKELFASHQHPDRDTKVWPPQGDA